MKKIVLISVVLGIIAFVVIKYWWILSVILLPAYKGDNFESWQTGNENFQIRVEAFHESNGGFVPGAFYQFASITTDTTEWKQIMTFRHDDPIQIERHKAHLVDDNVGFVFMGWMFASTADAGKTWTTWNACDKAAAFKVCNYQGIREVQMLPDGSGVMTLSTRPETEPSPKLVTKDFGRTWSE
ncbi:MAG TPA: hypothetical protein PKA82_05780 [Pyrinomonadaceae bacterium]|nr:hypothetical protein [Pyrinomonadaceae bacterium]